ncbi:uncharacterized protein [Elaeis guineensis]|uniref:uncharacterized protein n=1 Tax=Elaeis guineensis var. tenera TaxID=51953 RepID=UPI003C6DB5D3
MQRFCNQSGQCVNVQKSQIIFSPTIDRNVRGTITNLLQIQPKPGPLKYLGVPLSGSRLKTSDFNFIIEKITTRMAGWKWKLLSQVRRSILLQSILTSIPLHTLAHCVTPIGLLDKIQKHFKAFCWGYETGTRRIHLLAWNKICQPKELGELGIQDLRMRRMALMGTLAARVILTPTSLWSQVVWNKYHISGRWSSCRPPRKTSGIWRLICKSDWVVENATQWLIADGSEISILNDSWLSNTPLRSLPAMLNSDAVMDDDRVSSLMTEPGRRDLETSADYFHPDLINTILNLPILHIEDKDQCVWGLSIPGGLRRSGAWLLLLGSNLFWWKVLWGTLPCKAILQQRGIIPPGQAECDVCRVEEDINHSLFFCPVARQAWDLLAVYLGLTQPFNSLEDVLQLASGFST